MKKYITYLRYLLTHKYWVAYYCFKDGLYWRGLMHDLSKFRPDEFFPYVNFFGVAEKTKHSKDEFALAWARHLRRNTHHWNHWVIKKEDGGDRIFEMPEKDRREMIADWLGVQKTLGKDDLAGWYKERQITLGPKTRRWVEQTLEVNRYGNSKPIS